MRIHHQNNTRSKRSLPKRLSKKFWLYLVIGCLVLATLAFIWRKLDDWGHQLDVFVNKLQRQTGFVVEEVLVDGRQKTDKNHLLKTAKIHLKRPILSLPLSEVHDRIQSLPWVHEAGVERHLPDTILIRLKEHVPFALWQAGQKVSLISSDGKEIRIENPDHYAGLPKVVGVGALAQAKSFLVTLEKYPKVWKNFHYAQFVGKRRWTIFLKNNLKTRIDLPEKNYVSALERLQKYEKKHKATERFKHIDLRLKDKVIVKK